MSVHGPLVLMVDIVIFPFFLSPFRTVNSVESYRQGSRRWLSLAANGETYSHTTGISQSRNCELDLFAISIPL